MSQCQGILATSLFSGPLLTVSIFSILFISVHLFMFDFYVFLFSEVFDSEFSFDTAMLSAKGHEGDNDLDHSDHDDLMEVTFDLVCQNSHS